MPKTIKGNQHSATMDEVLEAVTTFADKTEQRFINLETDISGMKGDISGMETDISGIKGDIGQIKAIMVTKDYLDDKLSDLRGDLVVMTRKEDNKLKTLVGVLHDKKVITGSDVKKIYSLEPFAQ